MTGTTGQRMGNYRLVRLLGRGGFAEVYLGEHVRLGTQSAIKLLATHLSDSEAEEFLKVALEPPLFAAQATKSTQRVLSYSQWPLAAAFVERHAALGHLWRYSQGQEVVLCGVALGCSCYLRERGAR